ncbi:phosphatidylserine decarboxylase proenzyme 2 [Coccomyxa sp. Obi]|nr:phosphatidylserine decarboxylase proenzyme 2 [Coccomyxa sp. Obi]
MGGLVSRAAGWGAHCISPKIIDRETGEEIPEPEPYHGEVELGIFYGNWLGHLWLWTIIVRIYFRWRGKITGWMYNKPRSAKEIQQFAKTYQVNMSEVEKPVEYYGTLNEFFCRRLKDGVRPVAEPDNPRVAVSPADSRALVFDTVTDATALWIKGKNFTVAKLLGSGYDARAWEGCAIIINRLAPVDYHRLHAPVTGVLRKVTRVGSTLYAVEAAAINSPIDVYTMNERAIMEFDSPSFGTVIFCVIGASQVGSCNISAYEGDAIRKGTEVAFFKYGGSATLTLFKRNTIKWDEDLSSNSKNLWETKVKVGQSIGRRH